MVNATMKENIFVVLVDLDDACAQACMADLEQGDGLVVAAVGTGDSVGTCAGGAPVREDSSVIVEPMSSLQAVLDRTAPDLAVLQAGAWERLLQAAAVVMRQGGAVALLVGSGFPEAGDTDYLCDLDESALSYGVPAACYGSTAELREGMGALLSAPSGLVPSHLY